jgi:hypothetical protein
MTNVRINAESLRCWDVSRAVSLERLLTWCLDVTHVDRLLLATRLDKEARKPTLLAPRRREQRS